MKVHGWFFDVYPVKKGMIVWILDEFGNAQSFFDPFQPSFYLHLDSNTERKLPVLIQKLRLPVTLGTEKKIELFSGDEWQVAKVTVHDPLQFNRCVWSLQKLFPHFVFYNSNIPVAQMYLYDRQVFPLAYCEFAISDSSHIERICVEDSFDSYNYRIPDLRIMSLTNGGSEHAAKFSRTLIPELCYDGTTYTIEQSDPVDVLKTLNWHLQHYDPDIILTSWGDATLLPTLVSESLKNKIPLMLNSDLPPYYVPT